MRIIQKAKREILVALSKLCKKTATTDYLGLKLTFPLIYGMGRGYIIPAEYWMSECLRTFVGTKTGCVIDVGANVGVYLVKLRAVTDKVTYYGFEPNPVCNFYTQELVRLNSFNNAFVFPFALSDQQEVRMLYASKRGDKMASLDETHKQGQNLGFSLNVFTWNGDTFLRMLNIDAIAAIKIDVEGHELAVLTGLRETINQYRPYLYCEVLGFEPGDRSEKQDRTCRVYRLMTDLGYSIYGVDLQNRRLEEVSTVEAFGSHYSPEYIFVPKELREHFLAEINPKVLSNP